MYCPKCGSLNEDNAKFCRNCGVQLSGTTDTVPNVINDKYAGFWIRVLSGFIDSIFLLILNMFCGFSVGIMVGTATGSQGNAKEIATLVFILLGVFYEIWMHVRFGQTIGKMITRIRVVTTWNGYVTYKLSFLRWFGKIVCFFTLGIGFVIVAFHKQKRGLHDLIANTKVVHIKSA